MKASKLFQAQPMATSQGIELRVFNPQPGDDRHGEEEESARAAPNTEHEDSQQPAEGDWRPTRKYQAILLAAGFAMIFHVIGINSIYGIFQVNLPMRSRARPLRLFLGVLHLC